VLVDVDAFLAGAATALAAAAGPGIKLDVRPGDAPPVLIDPRLLERLLHNLVHNARDAMPDGGTITVTTARAGATTTISVADDGRGMPAEVLARAFEPFFSTKMGSRTAGLGLATAHGVVTQAGGELTLTSTPGSGTTALITLPSAAEGSPRLTSAGGPVAGAPTVPAHPAEAQSAAAQPAAAQSAAAQSAVGSSRADAAAPPTSAGRGRQTVLLVDDERDLREVTARFIAKAGYRVLTAGNGDEALEVAERHPETIDCLVTDVMMPGMDGRQLAHRFLSDRPGAKVVFISGYAEALIDDEGRSLEPGRTILAKPFSSAELTATLKMVLAA